MPTNETKMQKWNVKEHAISVAGALLHLDWKGACSEFIKSALKEVAKNCYSYVLEKLHSSVIEFIFDLNSLSYKVI